MYCKKRPEDDEDVDDFIDMLKKSAGTFGIKIKDPYFIVMPNTNVSAWVN